MRNIPAKVPDNGKFGAQAPQLTVYLCNMIVHLRLLTEKLITVDTFKQLFSSNVLPVFILYTRFAVGIQKRGIGIVLGIGKRVIQLFAAFLLAVPDNTCLGKPFDLGIDRYFSGVELILVVDALFTQELFVALILLRAHNVCCACLNVRVIAAAIDTEDVHP